MKKVIFGIFAHPDDEAFGPAATILMEKAAGNVVHLICATPGDGGTNPDNVEDLGAVRLAEWHKAGELMGVDSMHQLGYRDGHLSNHLYHEIAEKIRVIVTDTVREAGDVEIEFISMDHNGISGHLDHIFMGRVASYVFCNLKEHDSRVTRLRLICIPHDMAPSSNCNWLYMDAGRREDEIGEVIDGREHIDRVYEIMRAHHTQRHDGETHIRNRGEMVAVNHFLIVT